MKKLTALIFPEVFHWEREVLTPLFQQLNQNWELQVVELAKGERIPAFAREADVLWAISRKWQDQSRSISRLPAKKHFLSVMHLGSILPSLPTLFFRTFQPNLVRGMHLITHCPLNHRFFQEMQSIENSRVHLVPLPLPESSETLFKKEKKEFTVGAIGPFTRETNYNFLAGVAHYVRQKNQEIFFEFIGDGPLRKHLDRMIQGLGLSDRIRIREWDGKPLGFDVLLYAPTRNDHFVPVLCGAAEETLVIAAEIPGMEQFLVEGKTGFKVAVNEIKPMGELVLRAFEHRDLKESMGTALRETFKKKVSASQVASALDEIFSKGEVQVGSTATSAAV